MKKYELDMTVGSTYKDILLFSIPLFFTNVLQLLYNAADLIVVGRFDGYAAMSSVGATSALINLMINLFIGFATGAGVTISRYFGERNSAGMKRAVSTCVGISIIFGLVVMGIGLTFARPLLTIMSCPADLIDGAELYMRIYFIGMPAFMLFNFGSGVMRAVGDTKRPLRFLTISGLVNIALNLLFVIKFRMGVAGVACATVISQCLSAFFVMRCIVSTKETYMFSLKDIRIFKREFISMTKIGLPAGVQGSLFSLSNVIIQSSVNSFGSVVVAGNTAGMNVESFLYALLNSISQGTLTFTGQNYGKGNIKRIKEGLWKSFVLEFALVFTATTLTIIFSGSILSIYSKDAEVIRVGMVRLLITDCLYFLCGFNEVLAAVLRGLGNSVMPMITTVFAICGLRIIFIMTIFSSIRTLESLYVTYPVSWLIAAVLNAVCLVFTWKKHAAVQSG